MEREEKLIKVNNGGERMSRKWPRTSQPRTWGRRGPYIGPTRKLAVGNNLSRSLRGWKTGVSGLAAESPGPRLRGRLRGNFARVLDIRPESGPESPPSDRSLRPRAGVSAPLKTGRSSNTKTAITWASELRFWWTWARFEDNNELYKIMQRNIIVQHGRIKPNDERFDLSLNDESVKPPTSKNAIRYSFEIRFWWTRACHGDKHKL